MNKKTILIKVAFVIFIIAIALLFNRAHTESPTLTPEEAYDVSLSAWIYKLATCESGNNPEALNADDGGSASSGYVQYKVDTFYRYNKLLHVFPEMKKEDTVIYMKSKDNQIEMTKQIIRHTYEWENWKNCVLHHGVGLPPKLDEA